MSNAAKCQFCDGEIDEENQASGVCDGCWYGMRLEPEEWEKRMKKIGRVPRYIGGHVPVMDGDRVVGIGSRSPYAPGLVLVYRSDE